MVLRHKGYISYDKASESRGPRYGKQSEGEEIKIKRMYMTVEVAWEFLQKGEGQLKRKAHGKKSKGGKGEDAVAELNAAFQKISKEKERCDLFKKELRKKKKKRWGARRWRRATASARNNFDSNRREG